MTECRVRLTIEFDYQLHDIKPTAKDRELHNTSDDDATRLAMARYLIEDHICVCNYIDELQERCDDVSGCMCSAKGTKVELLGIKTGAA